MITKNWIWWWRQHWKGVTISKHTSEKRSVSRSIELRRTTDFSEGDKLLIWSMNIFQGLSVLFSIKLENNNIQDFDLRWEPALLLTSDPPSDKVLEGLYVSKLQDSSQAQTIMALCNQEILREGGKRDYHRLRMCVKLHIELAQRSNKCQDSERDYRACGRN